MKSSLLNEINKIKMISVYDSKKTLTENTKKIILESIQGGIYSVFKSLVGKIIKSSSDDAGTVIENEFKVLVRNESGEYVNKTYKIEGEAGQEVIKDSTGRIVDRIPISGDDITMSADDFLIAIGKKTGEVSDDGKKIIYKAIKDATGANKKLKNEFFDIADNIINSAGEDVVKTFEETINALSTAFKNGTSSEDIVEIFKKTIRETDTELTDEEIDFLTDFWLKNPKNFSRIVGQGSKLIRPISYALLHKIFKRFLQYISRITSTEEQFNVLIKQRLFKWLSELQEPSSDADAAKIFAKIRKETELLTDLGEYQKVWNEAFQIAEKNAITEFEKIITEELKFMNYTDDEISEFLNDIKSGDIYDTLDRYSVYDKNQKNLNFWTEYFGGAIKMIKDKLGIRDYISKKWMTEGKLNSIVGTAEAEIKNKIGLFFRWLSKWVNPFNNQFWRTIGFIDFGVFKSLPEFLENITRYGRGGIKSKKFWESFATTWAELMILKITIVPLIDYGFFMLILGLEKAYQFLFPGKDLKLINEKRESGQVLIDNYTRFFREFDGWSLIPVTIREEIVTAQLEWIGGNLMSIWNGLFHSKDESEETASANEKANIEKSKIQQQNLNNIANSAISEVYEEDAPEIEKLVIKEYEKVKELQFSLLRRNVRMSDKSYMRKNNLNDGDIIILKKYLKTRICPDATYTDPNYTGGPIDKVKMIKSLIADNKLCSGLWSEDGTKYYKVKSYASDPQIFYFIDDDGTEKPIKNAISKYSPITENYKIKMFDMKNLIRKIILEEEEEKTLKMKDWDEIFSFQKVDEKESGKYTDVKIKMDSVMDRMPHWRKKYKKQCEDIDNCDDDGEDDSFVRAVIDTHPEVVRVLFTKGMAHLTSSDDQEDLNESLHGLLAFLRESKNVEVEVWSVYRHPSSPDKIWSLVKGDYKPKELSSMDKKMQQSPGNSVEKKKDSLSELKKKESEAIRLLSTDEKKGLMELPIKVRNRVKEMIKKGWTTEKPSDSLMSYYKEDEVDSVFEDPIKVYKLRPNQTFFNFIKSQKSDDEIKRGFCRSIYYIEKEFDLPKEVSSKIDDILNKCENKLEGKYGQNYL